MLIIIFDKVSVKMFGLGFWEIVIICLVIIIFIRPDDIPGFVKKAGKIYGEIKKYYHEFILQFRKIEQEIKKPILQVTPEKQENFSENTSSKDENSEKQRKIIEDK